MRGQIRYAVFGILEDVAWAVREVKIRALLEFTFLVVVGIIVLVNETGFLFNRLDTLFAVLSLVLVGSMTLLIISRIAQSIFTAYKFGDELGRMYDRAWSRIH